MVLGHLCAMSGYPFGVEKQRVASGRPLGLLLWGKGICVERGGEVEKGKER